MVGDKIRYSFLRSRNIASIALARSKRSPGTVLLLTAMLSSGAAQVAPQPTGRLVAFDLEREMYVSTWVHPPVWSGGLLLRFEDNLTSSPLIDIVDRNLKHDTLSFDIKGASMINIRSVAAGADGTILVGGSAFSPDSKRAGFIARISEDLKNRTIIQTEPFCAESVALATDGTIWAVGLIFDGAEGRNNTHNVIQRYDASGARLSSKQVPDAMAWTGTPVTADLASRLLASRDRVGWLTNASQYIEYTLGGDELNRFWPPEGMNQQGVLDGVALSSNNDLILGRKGARGTEFLALDRAAKAWHPVSLSGRTSDYGVSILGFDSDTLVATTVPGTLRRFRESSK